MDIGPWETKKVDEVEIGDETLIDGEWQLVTAKGGLEHRGRRLYFGARDVFYPTHSDVMIKEK
jgi:hypothetical protein